MLLYMTRKRKAEKEKVYVIGKKILNNAADIGIYQYVMT